MLTIRLLGELEVRHDGAPVDLPPSRKTRALLGYLMASGKRHRRERLCELLWEIPDDPRGALRWSLSKLRSVLDRPGAPVVAADRLSVGVDLAAADVDLHAIRALLKGGVDAAPTEVLERAAELFHGIVLEHLDLPGQPEFQSWLVGVREETRRLHRAVLIALGERFAASPEKALPYVRELVALDVLEEDAWARPIALLNRLGRGREAEEQFAAASAALSEVGGVTHILEEARAGPARPVERPPRDPSEPRQEIRFCRSPDGTGLAYALAGMGPPLVKAANWLNHLEYDWESPIWGHLLHGLAQEHRLLRYDARGNGLSDWEPGELSLETWLADLETVVDAAGYDRFPLFGVSQGCTIAIAYAVKHPERVSHLVLYGGFAAGAFKRGDEAERELRRAMITLIRHGWGQSDPTFRQLFTSRFIPDATREQADAFNELQRRTASPEGAARYLEATASLDVRHLLGRVEVPTLVMHQNRDAQIPIELGRDLAAGIPGARFVPLPGQNHLFLETDESAPRFFEELRRFLAD
jgi:DNA-binding SARP family transcriptional activator/pimeloyl-ACP methyl ester carboxylesterase